MYRIIEEVVTKAKFEAGDKVQVLNTVISGHCRTPAYIRGKIGLIEKVQGIFPNPESRAYGGDGRPKQVLYLVSFDQACVWKGNRTSFNNKLFVDIYEHWLKPA